MKQCAADSTGKSHLARLSVEKRHPLVTTVHVALPTRASEQWFLLRSDAHHDNEYCDHVLERQHLEQAKERDAGILDFGDLFCAMQGKWDKRADQDQMRAELRGNNYLDLLVDYCARFYEPFAPNWVLLSPGNHETAILRHHATNLGERLAGRLRAVGSPVVLGTFRGWVQFRFKICGTQRESVRLHYHHGYGGGGPVTRDVIATNRQMVYLDADIIVTGHTHDQFALPIRRERLNQAGIPVQCDVEHIKCGGYKDEFSPGEGFAVERGRNPKPLGAYWLRFYLVHDRKRNHAYVKYDVIRAH